MPFGPCRLEELQPRQLSSMPSDAWSMPPRVSLQADLVKRLIHLFERFSQTPPSRSAPGRSTPKRGFTGSSDESEGNVDVIDPVDFQQEKRDKKRRNTSTLPNIGVLKQILSFDSYKYKRVRLAPSPWLNAPRTGSIRARGAFLLPSHALPQKRRSGQALSPQKNIISSSLSCFCGT